KLGKDPQDFGVPKGVDRLEGWLFPATYTFEPDITAKKAIQTMVDQTIKELDKLKVPKADREDVLIKASLVEREAGREEDRPKMASVIENRLEHDWTLGIDASVAYGLDKSGLDLTKSELNSKDNPYNTRVLLGLPPTPISSPGL